jgi:glycosyltransferase involved in cell wall biosynthesis
MYYDAIDAFKKLGVELVIVASAKNIGNFSEKFSEKGCMVFHKPFPKGCNYLGRIRYYKSFIRFLKDEKIDVVHNHSSRIFWDISLSAHIAGVKSIYTFHNVFTPHWYSYLYHFGLRIMAKYIFKSQYHTISDSVFNNELKLYKNPTIKIFNWINTNRFYPPNAHEKATIRKELVIAENAFIMISVGECSEIKRHSDIIKSLPRIKKSIPNLIYIHLGNGKLLQSEKELASRLEVENNILFFESQFDVRKFLIASDVYIMTSKFEGISLTTIEAMACRIPTILYNVPGLCDFNKYKTTSFLIQEKPAYIAEKVISIYNSDSETTEVVEQAILNVKLNYSMNSNVKDIFELYL